MAHPYQFVVPANGRLNARQIPRVSAHPLETLREDASEACPLPIDHVRHVASLAQAALLKKLRRLRLLRGNRLSAWEPISQIVAQLLVRSWDNGWDNRRGSTRDRIALKQRQRNDLVGFELFLRSQTLYPTELRARP